MGWWPRICCLKFNWGFIRTCKQGCLQSVILKLVLAAVTLTLYPKGKYADGNFCPNQSYLCLTIIYTISYTMALYALAIFYASCRDLLQPFNPVPKFIIIKSVIFLTYWQGVLVFLVAKSGLIKNAEDAAQYQNFIICVEMLIAAAGHLYAFPYKEYAGGNIGEPRGLTGSPAHALKLNDFYHDTVHQFPLPIMIMYSITIMRVMRERGSIGHEAKLCVDWPRDGCWQKKQAHVWEQDT